MADDSRWIALLLRLYPRAYRERHAAELAETMRACVERERRAGHPSALTAAHLAADAVTTSLLVRSSSRASSGDPVMQSIAADLR